MALFDRDLTPTPISALNAVSTELGAVDLANITELTFYIVGSAGISAGAVQAEEAHEAGYTGTWAPNGSPVTVTADAVKSIKITGVARAARIRISTLVADGTITVKAIGR